MIKITDEILMSYADGELDESIAKQVEQVLVNDVNLRDKVTRHHALRSEFDLAFDDINETPISNSIMKLLEANDTNVVSLSSHLKQKPLQNKKQWWQPIAIAASITVAFLIGMFSSGPVTNSDLLTVNTEVAQVLDSLPSGSTKQDIHIQGSFVRDDGSLCRTFQDLSSDSPTDALSCRDISGEWKIITLIPGIPANAYLPASGDTENIIKQITNSMLELSKDNEKKHLK